MPAFHPLQAALHPKTVSHRERSYGGVRCREAETVTGEQRTLARSSDLSIGTIVPSETPLLQHRELCDQNTDQFLWFLFKTRLLSERAYREH